jgi:hypothetical protein
MIIWEALAKKISGWLGSVRVDLTQRPRKKGKYSKKNVPFVHALALALTLALALALPLALPSPLPSALPLALPSTSPSPSPSPLALPSLALGLGLGLGLALARPWRRGAPPPSP